MVAGIKGERLAVPHRAPAHPPPSHAEPPPQPPPEPPPERPPTGRAAGSPLLAPPRPPVPPPGEGPPRSTDPAEVLLSARLAPAAPAGWPRLDDMAGGTEPAPGRVLPTLQWVPADPVRRAGWLAAVLYLLIAVAAAVQAFAQGSEHHRMLLVGVAVGTALTGVVVMALPWSRYREWATLVPVLWGFAGFGALGASVDGATRYFLPAYAIAFLYLGLTQRPGVALVMTAPAASAAVGAAAGRHDLAALPELLLAVVVSAAVAELVAILRSGQEMVRGGLEEVIDVAAEMLDCDSAPALVVHLAERTRTVLAADGALVLLVDPADAAVYLSAAVSLRDPDDPAAARVRTPLLLDVDEAPAGVGRAVRSREPVFVPAGRRQFSSSALDELPQLGAGSAVFVPLVGRFGVPGMLITWWHRGQRRMDPVAARMVGLLGRQAGPVLERMRQLAVLETEASTDPLTGLANRRTFRTALTGLPAAGAVAILDLDHFKQLNDRFGHAVGDKALTAFAGVLAEELRVADCAARYGGEEFAIALGDEHAAVRALDRLRDRWSAISAICLPPRYRITFSAGIAVRRRGEDPDELLARADAALYRAKAAGRNRTILDGPDTAVETGTGPTLIAPPRR